jgi:hypothetical protein
VLGSDAMQIVRVAIVPALRLVGSFRCNGCRRPTIAISRLPAHRAVLEDAVSVVCSSGAAEGTAAAPDIPPRSRQQCETPAATSRAAACACAQQVGGPSRAHRHGTHQLRVASRVADDCHNALGARVHALGFECAGAEQGGIDRAILRQRDVDRSAEVAGVKAALERSARAIRAWEASKHSLL